MQILFKTLALEHLEKVRRWRQSPDVTKYMYTDPQITTEQQIEWFKRVSKDPSRRDYIICVDSEDVGFLSLSKITDDSCFWAYYLGELSARGKGVGTAVELNVADYVFNTLQLNSLRCGVFSWNDRVIYLHEKLGAHITEHFNISKNGVEHGAVVLVTDKVVWLSEIGGKYTYPSATWAENSGGIDGTKDV